MLALQEAVAAGPWRLEGDCVSGDPILLETFGDSPHNLTVLSFFLERPLHAYAIPAVACALKLTVEEVSRALVFFIRTGYIIRRRAGYELNRADKMVRAIMRCEEILGDAYYNVHIAPLLEVKSHYFKQYPVNKRESACVICGREKESLVHKKWRGRRGGHNLGNERVGDDK